MKSAHDLLYIGTHGHVTAVRKTSGRRVWSTSLPKTGYDLVTLLIEDGQLFAVSKGYLFALDPQTGRVLWTNGLKGLGHGFATLATLRSGAAPGPTLFGASRAAEAQAGAGGY